MYHRKFIPLLLSIAFCLGVNAQTKNNTNRASQKTTSASTTKVDTTAKGMMVSNVRVKDAGDVKQPVTQTPSQASPEKKPTQTTIKPVTEKVKKTSAAATMPSPFKAGTLRISNQSMVNFYRYNRGGTYPGKDNELDANLSVTWFPVNGLGIGVNAGYSDSYYSTSGTTSDFKTWSAYFHLMYGYAFNNRYHALVKVAYGPSKGDSKTSLGLNKNRLMSSFKDIAVSVGAPVRIEKEGTLFVTPLFTYDQSKGTAGSHDLKDKMKGFTIRLESYLPLSGGEKQSKNYYERGTQFVDYNSRFDWHTTTREEYQGTTMFAPRKYNTRFLHAGYGMYILNNIAASLNIEVNHIRNENPGSADDVKNSVSLQPSVIAQLPVEGALNHLFAQVSYEFSRGKESGQVKTKESNVDFRVGYNLFMAKNLALTPRFGYTIDKSTNSYVNSTVITKSKGLAGELILRAWLDWKWLK
ncbi:MAG: hypothetical protein QM802_04905 [Agriterribacter sp.]